MTIQVVQTEKSHVIQLDLLIKSDYKVTCGPRLQECI